MVISFRVLAGRPGNPDKKIHRVPIGRFVGLRRPFERFVRLVGEVQDLGPSQLASARLERSSKS